MRCYSTTYMLTISVLSILIERQNWLKVGKINYIIPLERECINQCGSLFSCDLCFQVKYLKKKEASEVILSCAYLQFHCDNTMSIKRTIDITVRFILVVLWYSTQFCRARLFSVSASVPNFRRLHGLPVSLQRNRQPASQNKLFYRYRSITSNIKLWNYAEHIYRKCMGCRGLLVCCRHTFKNDTVCQSKNSIFICRYNKLL